MNSTRLSYRWVCLLCVLALAGTAFWCRVGNRQVEQPQPVNPQPVQPQPGVETTEPVEEPPQSSGQPNLEAQAAVTPTGSGSEVRVEVSVRNGGGGTVAAPFTVRWLPDSRTEEVGCSWDIQANRINQGTVRKSCTYTYSRGGGWQWRVVVDAEDEIAETDEADNLVRGQVQVSGGGGGSGPLSAPQNCRWRVASVPVVIVLEWDYPQGEAVDGFVVYMATTDEQVRVAGDQRQAVVSNLAPATQYHFDVRAVRGGQVSAVDACQVDATTGQ